jgi:hypothetical protein
VSTVEDAFTVWREFYAAVANASAALVGLVFVGLSIRLSRRGLEPSAKALGLVSLANLLYPLYVSVAMLLPQGVPPSRPSPCSCPRSSASSSS